MDRERPTLFDFDDLWDFDHPAESEARFRELLPGAESSGDRARLAQLLTQVARAQGRQRNFAEAHATLDRVEAMLLPGLPVTRVRYLLERGRVFNTSGDPGEARPLFLQAWEEARSARADYFAVDAAHMLAVVEPPERQLDWDEKALALAESSADPKAHKWLGPLYNNAGWTYHDLGRYEEALATFEKALAWREEQGSLPEIRIARWSVGRALRSMGRIDEALAIQEALQVELTAAGQTDGYVYEELAVCLLAEGREAEARPWA